MTTGLHYLDVGLVVAVFAGIFWWMISLSFRSSAQRKRELAIRKVVQQPWDTGRRGSR